ncbi:MAG: bifunctional UDP-N-acetylmuramoyl-tripeptide:D-alanyl-D-alanine ligase/alanine racemase [Candidatus Dadabacteria bacterium]
MKYAVSEICDIVRGKFISKAADSSIEHLVYDTRKIQQAEASLFFAIVTQLNDGHKYLNDAYAKGIKNFIVSSTVELATLQEANVIVVDDTLVALQELAAFHRSKFSLPVIGITGSNGKTIVKEWLYQLLQENYNIARSPKSYNSQIGVALSICQINSTHTLAIIEAGISKTGEMDRLEKMIRPTIGVITNIGDAHSEGFSSVDEKLSEKKKLFTGADIIIGPFGLLKDESKNVIMSWGTDASAQVRVIKVERLKSVSCITVEYKGNQYLLEIPFQDTASVHNAITCLCVLFYLGVRPDDFLNKFKKLHPVDMRMQLKHGLNQCFIINDSYSADPTSLRIAIDFLKQQALDLGTTAILSDFYESGKNDEVLYREIAHLLNEEDIEKIVGIGEKISRFLPLYLKKDIQQQYYFSTDDYINRARTSDHVQEIILIKGARRFEFERIVQLFDQKVHQTVLEIDLSALVHNLKEYRNLLVSTTKVMAMVKAFSYGSGGAEIASVLQYHNVDFLGVAYADEGVELVKAGISLPIMIMNTEESSFYSIVQNNLQPVIFSYEMLDKFQAFLVEEGLTDYPVHLEIETGMNRLGFNVDDIENVARRIAEQPYLRVQSVFSHLAASEDPKQDDFTKMQYTRFMQAVASIKKYLNYPFLRHISNSASIVRHPSLQLDMVRLGIGLYGVEADAEDKLNLKAVATLRSTIAQLKQVPKGESVSYNRRGVVQRDSLIGTIRIGYADGYSRMFSNGTGKVLVRGTMVPVIGSVCMDMTMIDVTDVPGVAEGDDVVIFGENLPIENLAEWIHTIPYEIMTSVSQRVKRVYFHE